MPRRIQLLRVGTLSVTALISSFSLSGCLPGTAPEKSHASAGASKSLHRVLPMSLTSQVLDWKPCLEPTPAQGAGLAPGKSWECATLKVPLNYAKPDGETIGIAVIRAKATESARRIGSLVFNFGGPGGSGVTGLPGLADSYQTLRSRYDLVSFDPRGVGESAGIKCLSDSQLDAAQTVDTTPDNNSEIKAVDIANAQYAESCARNSGKVLPYVDTISTARDMDLLREALGDKKLNYFGISYGTKLGGVYAHLFPKNVGHAVLDAVVDPTESTLSHAIGQARGFQLALDHYMKDCAITRGSKCPTGKGGGEGSQKIATLLKQLDRHPLPTDDGRNLTQGLALTGIVGSLYDKEAWKPLTTGLEEAMTSDRGDTLLAIADMYNGRSDRGGGAHYTNMSAANKAISCADDKKRYTTHDAQTLLPEFRKASPVFGESMAWNLTTCAGWPVDGQSTSTDVQADGAPPILVIGNTGDPATPYQGAVHMSKALGEGVGALVTLKGEGHGGYNSGNNCLKETVDSYLLSDKTPFPGLSCM